MEIEKQRKKLGGGERWLSLAAGSAAVYYGLKRRSWFGWAVALAGSNLVARGVTGERRVLEYLGLKGPADRGLPAGHAERGRPIAEERRASAAIEPVEEGSIESFPASDAPAWMAGGGR